MSWIASAREMLQQLRRHAAGAADLAGQDDAVGGDQRLAGHAGIGVGGQEGVQHRVGDPVGHLVGMAFGDALRGEQDTRPCRAWRDSSSCRGGPASAAGLDAWARRSGHLAGRRARVSQGGRQGVKAEGRQVGGASVPPGRSAYPSRAHASCHRAPAPAPAATARRAPRRWHRRGGRSCGGSARCARMPAANSSVCSPTTWPPRSAAKPMVPVLAGAGMAVPAALRAGRLQRGAAAARHGAAERDRGAGGRVHLLAVVHLQDLGVVLLGPGRAAAMRSAMARNRFTPGAKLAA